MWGSVCSSTAIQHKKLNHWVNRKKSLLEKICKTDILDKICICKLFLCLLFQIKCHWKKSMTFNSDLCFNSILKVHDYPKGSESQNVYCSYSLDHNPPVLWVVFPCNGIYIYAHVLICVFSLHITVIRHPIDCPALLFPSAFSVFFLSDGKVGSNAASHAVAHHAVPTVRSALIITVHQLRAGQETEINHWSRNITTEII